jgi:hypothetical protein
VTAARAGRPSGRTCFKSGLYIPNKNPLPFPEPHFRLERPFPGESEGAKRPRMPWKRSIPGATAQRTLLLLLGGVFLASWRGPRTDGWSPGLVRAEKRAKGVAGF